MNLSTCIAWQVEVRHEVVALIKMINYLIMKTYIEKHFTMAVWHQQFGEEFFYLNVLSDSV